MPGRKYTAQNYRYGFNGQEHDDEVFAGANTAEYWMYDARLGRRWEIDPLWYEFQSPYGCFNNNPIYYSDFLGLEGDDDGNKDGDKGGNKGGDKGKTKTKDDLAQETVNDLNKNCPGCYVYKDGVITNNPNKPSENNSSQRTSNSNPPTTENAPKPDGTKQPTQTQGQSNDVAKRLKAFYDYGGDGTGNFSDWGMWVLDKVRIFSPLTQLNDAANIALWGKDSRGIPKGNVDIGYSILGGIPLVGAEANTGKTLLFEVGSYNELKAAAVGTGLDAHHVGQAAIFEKIIPGYNRKTAPAILVPKIGHTTSKEVLGIVNRTVDFTLKPRVVLARDALELRRVYQVPGVQIQKLIDMNKKMYPNAFKK